MSSQIEILAPAGSLAVAETAIDVGADAIYLGLKHFNARRGAENFSPETLAIVVEKAHAKGVKVYLTLNIDLTQRELQQALRAIQLAADLKVDAILVRDPALLKLVPFFPKLNFHFSTQAAICTSAGMMMAKQLGIKRVVLPREMMQDEIEACCKIKDIETEVFVQGALCFSVSGRCLLSSWVGGRSGNRGTCASPCRVGYISSTCQTEEKCHPFSMHDLSLIEHVQTLQKLGVNSLKIEGRLKSANWVKNAIQLYKNAVSTGKGIIQSHLGAYTGREQTDGFFMHTLHDLTAESAGRERTQEQSAAPSLQSIPTTFEIGTVESVAPLKITVFEDDRKGINFKLEYGARESLHRIPPRVIKKIEKAIPLTMQCESMREEAESLFPEIEIDIQCSEETLLMPTQFNQLDKEFSVFMRLCHKPEDTTIRYPIADDLKQLFHSEKTANAKNNRLLGAKWECVRLSLKDVKAFVKENPYTKIKVDMINISDYQSIYNVLQPQRLIIAIPSVFYEEQIPQIEALLDVAVKNGHVVEVNNWDALYLAKKYDCRFECGYGLGVINAVAADVLYALGAEKVALSVEADAEQLIHVCEVTDVPLTINTYGRLALLTTRVPGKCDAHFIDARGCELFAEKQGDLTLYRSLKPYNITDKMSKRIHVSRIEMDLSCSENPVNEVKKFGRFDTGDMRFNYERSLK